MERINVGDIVKVHAASIGQYDFVGEVFALCDLDLPGGCFDHPHVAVIENGTGDLVIACPHLVSLERKAPSLHHLAMIGQICSESLFLL